MRVRGRLLTLYLLLACLLLGGCRFAVVESDAVRIDAPTPTPPVVLTDLESSALPAPREAASCGFAQNALYRPYATEN